MKVKSLAEDDRPREKFLLKGKEALSDADLLAIIIGSGNIGESVIDLGRRILRSVNNNWHQLSLLTVKDLMKYKGIGEVKAITIVAALEIGRRKALQEVSKNPVISNSKDAFNILHPYLGDLHHEEFWCLFLNQSNTIIHKEKLTHGGIDQSIVDARILFSIALDHLATAIVVAHNHPSGNLKPSRQDIQITESLKNGGELLNIRLLDHLIISQDSFFSFSDEGIL